jgi:hypothetical protein
MKIKPPGQDVPIQLPNGSVDPLWYAFLTQKRNALDADDVDNSTAITNGQVLVWDNTAKKFKPGAN